MAQAQRLYRHPGALLHIDTTLIQRADDRSWQYLHVAIDDATRLAFLDVMADTTEDSCCSFLRAAVRWYAHRGIAIRTVMSDNGRGYGMYWMETALGLGLTPVKTRPWDPNRNGKAERLIQTVQRECLTAAFESAQEQRRAVRRFAAWYNGGRPHSALGGLTPAMHAERERS